VVIAGGSPGKRGAARLAAIAAVRAGAGLVTLAGPAAGGEIAAPDPVMTEAIEDARELAALLVGKAAVVIGPGMVHVRRGGRARAVDGAVDVRARDVELLEAAAEVSRADVGQSAHPSSIACRSGQPTPCPGRVVRGPRWPSTRHACTARRRGAVSAAPAYGLPMSDWIARWMIASASAASR
jgi:hypothetical protein